MNRKLLLEDKQMVDDLAIRLTDHDRKPVLMELLRWCEGKDDSRRVRVVDAFVDRVARRMDKAAVMRPVVEWYDSFTKIHGRKPETADFEATFE